MPATHLGKAATVPYLTSVASPSLLTALCKHSTTEDIKCWAFLHNLGLLVLKPLFSYFLFHFDWNQGLDCRKASLVPSWVLLWAMLLEDIQNVVLAFFFSFFSKQARLHLERQHLYGSYAKNYKCIFILALNIISSDLNDLLILILYLYFHSVP